VPDALAPILAEARAAVARGGAPDVEALSARIRAAGAAPTDERRALDQLERVARVARARATLARPPAAPAAPPPRSLRSQLRTRPSINANMDVRRELAGDRHRLVWDAATGVTGWEVRISARPSPRAEYAVRDTQELPGSATSVDLELGDETLRVHLLGRDRTGRLLRRAVMSGLTAEGWTDRWQRRASAS
jgi:hypothetical protein